MFKYLRGLTGKSKNAQLKKELNTTLKARSFNVKNLPSDIDTEINEYTKMPDPLLDKGQAVVQVKSLKNKLNTEFNKLFIDPDLSEDPLIKEIEEKTRKLRETSVDNDDTNAKIHKLDLQREAIENNKFITKKFITESDTINAKNTIKVILGNLLRIIHSTISEIKTNMINKIYTSVTLAYKLGYLYKFINLLYMVVQNNKEQIDTTTSYALSRARGSFITSFLTDLESERKDAIKGLKQLHIRINLPAYANIRNTLAANAKRQQNNRNAEAARDAQAAQRARQEQYERGRIESLRRRRNMRSAQATGQSYMSPPKISPAGLVAGPKPEEIVQVLFNLFNKELEKGNGISPENAAGILQSVIPPMLHLDRTENLDNTIDVIVERLLENYPQTEGEFKITFIGMIKHIYSKYKNPFNIYGGGRKQRSRKSKSSRRSSRRSSRSRKSTSTRRR